MREAIAEESATVEVMLVLCLNCGLRAGAGVSPEELVCPLVPSCSCVAHAIPGLPLALWHPSPLFLTCAEPARAHSCCCDFVTLGECRCHQRRTAQLPATSYSHDSEPNHILPETKALGEPGVGQEPAGQREGIEAETWEAEAIYLPYSWAWLGPSLGSAWERMTQNRGP